jgi:Phage integrase family
MSGVNALLISERGGPYTRFGIDAMMDRLEAAVGFRVHAHGFRHTFATVATKLGWNFEHLRAAMGHATSAMLQRYVRLANERDLGPLKDWSEFVVANPALGFPRVKVDSKVERIVRANPGATWRVVKERTLRRGRSFVRRRWNSTDRTRSNQASSTRTGGAGDMDVSPALIPLRAPDVGRMAGIEQQLAEIEPHVREPLSHGGSQTAASRTWASCLKGSAVRICTSMSLDGVRPCGYTGAMRTLRALISAAALAGLVLTGPTALSTAGRHVGVAVAATTTTAPDEVTASAAAEAQGVSVEAMSDRTSYAQVFANPDGTFTYNASPVPPADGAQLLRAYALLRAHGRGLCRRSAPVCVACPLVNRCNYALRVRRQP